MAQVGLLEDNMHVAQLCVTMLNYVGHNVIVYRHPWECLHALLPEVTTPEGWRSIQSFPSTFPLPVEVLIIDLYLPDIDGVEVIQYLRSHPRTQSLPLICCTAASANEIARARKLVPQVSVVEKPYTLQTLTRAIATALKRPTFRANTSLQYE